MEDLLVWADVETTGLNPNSDLLLEVAAFVTDKDLNLLDEDGYHAVVRWDPSYARGLANAFVQAMHDKTDLWSKLRDGTPVEQVSWELHDYIEHYAPEPRQARLAGNSVRLDANFIDHFLPEVGEHLHYRLLDVSSIAFEVYNVKGVTPFEKKALHSAVSDIRESIAELKYLRENY